jgi:hypothetical protein
MTCEEIRWPTRSAAADPGVDRRFHGGDLTDELHRHEPGIRFLGAE